MATRVEKTVGPTGDYASLAAFFVGEARNLVTADEIAVARCQTFQDTTAAPVNAAQGWVTDATRRIMVEGITDPGGIRSSGAAPSSYNFEVLAAGTGACIVDVNINITFKQIQGRNIGAGAGTNIWQTSVGGGSTGDILFDRVVGSASAHAVYAVAGATTPVRGKNCFMYAGNSVLRQNSSHLFTFKACTLASYNAGQNTILTTASAIYKNCYMETNGGVANPAGTGTYTTCATSDGSAATVALRNITYNNTNFVNTFVDSHILAVNPMIDAATDISADADLPVDTDVDDNGFGTAGLGWDVGYHELGGVPLVTYENPDDLTHILRGVYDVTNNKFIVQPQAAVSTGGLLSTRQIFSACWNTARRLNVVDVGGVANANIEKLSMQQILQKVYDPGAGALRVQQGVAAGAGSSLSTEQIFRACYDPTNSALRCSPAGAGGTPGGSLMSVQQILQAVYDPGVGLRMSL